MFDGANLYGSKEKFPLQFNYHDYDELASTVRFKQTAASPEQPAFMVE